MRVPRATYRLQFNQDFTFSRAEKLVPYLSALGVDTLYASPLTRARAGSTHGYDVVDPNAFNPELGTREDFDRLVRALRDHGMGLLLDVVPNHMGVGDENAWWMDLLENGPASPYARFFDVDWLREGLAGKVLLPVLGDHYRSVLERGELELTFDADGGAFYADYFEHRFPLDPETYSMVLEGLPGQAPEELRRVMESFRGLVGHAGVKGRLARLHAGSAGAARAIEDGVRRISGDPEALHRLLEAQAYRLAFWRVGGDEINYRRFFAVNDLAGVRVEDEAVFDATHRMVLDLVTRGDVDGLRIDHPDGLHDPGAYLCGLQERAPEGPLYVLVEKILASGEDLPEDWPVSGTTGYEFANLVTGLFVDPAGEAGLDAAYRDFAGVTPGYDEIAHDRKMLVMRTDLASELDALARLLTGISDHDRRRDFTFNQLRDALSAVVARFSVYRTYVAAGSVSETDRRRIGEAVSRAGEDGTAADTAAFDFVREALTLDLDGPEGFRNEVLRFAMKFQQYTGPVMAKGVEDAALYVYNRLVSLNEVGGEPDRFGVPVPEFHRANLERAERLPHSMLSTSTHDTKRGEDVRARISVLSEIPGEWRDHLARWAGLNEGHRVHTGRTTAPGPNDEYLIYQTLLGAWPLEGLDEEGFDEEGLGEFRGRILGYVEKAIREAQVHTSWTDPDPDYEAGVARFVEALLTRESPFVRDFLPLQRRVARTGAVNSLVQTLLKLTAPGVPDVYQGNELWDFSLVDPDNRRPVDFSLGGQHLAELRDLDPSSAHRLLEDGSWQDGRPKLYLISRTLELRRAKPDLFVDGEYVPLETSGEQAERVVAFARRRGREAAITVAPRLCAHLLRKDGPLLTTPEGWADTFVHLPAELAGATYVDVLTGEKAKAADGEGLRVGPLFRGFPVVLLTTEG